MIRVEWIFGTQTPQILQHDVKFNFHDVNEMSYIIRSLVMPIASFIKKPDLIVNFFLSFTWLTQNGLGCDCKVGRGRQQQGRLGWGSYGARREWPWIDFFIFELFIFLFLKINPFKIYFLRYEPFGHASWSDMAKQHCDAGLASEVALFGHAILASVGG